MSAQDVYTHVDTHVYTHMYRGTFLEDAASQQERHVMNEMLRVLTNNSK